MLDIVEFDKDGAIEETAAEAEGYSRLGFLRRVGAVGGAVATVSGLGGAFASAASANTGGHGRRYERGRPPISYGAGDVGIMNFALLLEYLEAALYAEALESRAIDDPATRAFVRLALADERAHVELLKSLLGPRAIKLPTFEFAEALQDEAKFQRTAYELENLGVAAYLGQMRNLYSPERLTDAAGIATVEGRHAAIIGGILSNDESTLVPNGPVDAPLSAHQIITTVNGTGFVTGGAPKGTGGNWTPLQPHKVRAR